MAPWWSVPLALALCVAAAARSPATNVIMSEESLQDNDIQSWDTGVQ
jgi:hypothetical protein